MKKIILLLFLILASCSSDDCNQYNEPQTKSINICPIVFSIGEDIRGSFILVGFNQNNPTDRKRYKVINYNDYKLGQTICDFNNLTEQPL
jgi:hypothetical protein